MSAAWKNPSDGEHLVVLGERGARSSGRCGPDRINRLEYWHDLATVDPSLGVDLIDQRGLGDLEVAGIDVDDVLDSGSIEIGDPELDPRRGHPLSSVAVARPATHGHREDQAGDRHQRWQRSQWWSGARRVVPLAWTVTPSTDGRARGPAEWLEACQSLLGICREKVDGPCERETASSLAWISTAGERPRPRPRPSWGRT